MDEAPRTRIYVDWGKLAQIGLIVASVTVLGVVQVITEPTVALILGAASGYIFGNGKSIKEGTPPAPLLGRRPADDQTWTLEPELAVAEYEPSSTYEARKALAKRLRTDGNDI